MGELSESIWGERGKMDFIKCVNFYDIEENCFLVTDEIRRTAIFRRIIVLTGLYSGCPIPFYMSSGTSSGHEGTWLPFLGIGRHKGELCFLKPRPVPFIKYLFDKCTAIHPQKNSWISRLGSIGCLVMSYLLTTKFGKFQTSFFNTILGRELINIADKLIISLDSLLPIYDNYKLLDVMEIYDINVLGQTLLKMYPLVFIVASAHNNENFAVSFTSEQLNSGRICYRWRNLPLTLNAEREAPVKYYESDENSVFRQEDIMVMCSIPESWRKFYHPELNLHLVNR